MSDKQIFRLPPRYANTETLNKEEQSMLDLYKKFADENGIEVTYDKELDVALVIFTPNY